jgi:hypothetical protein
MYVNDVKKGICDGKGEATLLKETAATAFVDGNNALGPTVANFCMKLAIKKAKEVGVGWVVAKGPFITFYFLRKCPLKILVISFCRLKSLRNSRVVQLTSCGAKTNCKQNIILDYLDEST